MAETLPTLRVEKPWGRESLPPPFTSTPGQTIGEIWFDPPVGADDLLIKYLFTSDWLSVQVHPNDEQAKALGVDRGGKDECWYVLDADPGAVLGIGFKRAVSSADMRQAAEDGSIMDLLDWHPVKPGDFFYIPANTVHAIGPGVSIIEIQQNSDITYRLYDYGRPRELHLDQAVAVADRQPYDRALYRHLQDGGTSLIVDGPYFRLWRVDGMAGWTDEEPVVSGPAIVLPYHGEVRIGSERVGPGQCALADDACQISFPLGSLGFVAQSL